MSVLAHGAAGPADELILLVPAVALLVLAVAGLRRRNQRLGDEARLQSSATPEDADRES